MAQRTNQNYPPWIKDLVYLAVIAIGLIVGYTKVESRLSVVETTLSGVIKDMEEERSKYISEINEKVTEIQRLLEEKQNR